MSHKLAWSQGAEHLTLEEFERIAKMLGKDVSSVRIGKDSVEDLRKTPRRRLRKKK